jgi:hypothetical protein
MTKNDIFFNYWLKMILALPMCIVFHLGKALLELIKSPFYGFVAGCEKVSGISWDYKLHSHNLKKN